VIRLTGSIFNFLSPLNRDLATYSTTNVTPSNLGMALYYRRYGATKSIATSGTHTTTWTADTEYGLATMGGVYLPKYSWSKRIVYKVVVGTPYFAVLKMDTSGNLTITPENVISGGIIRIHEVYF